MRGEVSTHPALYLPVARRKYGHLDHRVVDRDTQLVIDGFQRSANTFAVAAFEMVQPEPVRTVHHLHAAAQLIQAARWGLPAVALIREPRDCVVSHVVFEGCLTVGQALWTWTRFYRRLLPHRSALVVADFVVVTTDFGRVVSAVNGAFGTEFVPFDHTEENERRCFELIEERERRGTPGRAIRESRVPRPSPERDALKRRLQWEYDSTRLAGLRGRAEEVYGRLLESSPVG